jgi:hypothetical protein
MFTPRFPLGKVEVKKEALHALSVAGQEPSFFLEMHASAHWGEGNPELNEQGLREGSMVLSVYRTLRGHELQIITFLGKGETCVFCPPNSVFKYVPLPDLAIWGKPKEEEMKGHGNGTGRFEVNTVDMGGWVRVSATGPAPDDLPVFLSETLAEWFRQRPQMRLVFVVPITRSGATVELHAWYECHVFPASSAAPKPLQ